MLRCAHTTRLHPHRLGGWNDEKKRHFVCVGEQPWTFEPFETIRKCFSSSSSSQFPSLSHCAAPFIDPSSSPSTLPPRVNGEALSCCSTVSAVYVIIKQDKNNSQSQIFTRLNDVPLLLDPKRLQGKFCFSEIKVSRVDACFVSCCCCCSLSRWTIKPIWQQTLPQCFVMANVRKQKCDGKSKTWLWERRSLVVSYEGNSEPFTFRRGPSKLSSSFSLESFNGKQENLRSSNKTSLTKNLLFKQTRSATRL